MKPDHLQRLVAENKVFLHQLEALLARVSAAEYRRLVHDRHSLGRHLRHIAEHYEALLNAVSNSDVPALNYEERARDPALEDSPEAGRSALSIIGSALDDLTRTELPDSLPMVYPCTAGPDASVANPQDSPLPVTTTVERELVFLASHTVHHMALIGLLAPHIGIRLPQAFGVHPSTLRHWARQQPGHHPETAENS